LPHLAHGFGGMIFLAMRNCPFSVALRSRNERVREVEEQSTAKQHQERGKRHIEPRTPSRHLPFRINLLGDLQEADSRNRDHGRPHYDQGQTDQVRKPLSWYRQLASRKRGRCHLKKEIELLDQESEGHDRRLPLITQGRV
jgi:hypothetical protein